jgi:hypothetical protein
MPVYSADFWAANAQASRKIAAAMRNEDARNGMLTAAARCEELANAARQSEGAEVISAEKSSALPDQAAAATRG